MSATSPTNNSPSSASIPDQPQSATPERRSTEKTEEKTSRVACADGSHVFQRCVVQTKEHRVVHVPRDIKQPSVVEDKSPSPADSKVTVKREETKDEVTVDMDLSQTIVVEQSTDDAHKKTEEKQEKKAANSEGPGAGESIAIKAIEGVVKVVILIAEKILEDATKLPPTVNIPHFP